MNLARVNKIKGNVEIYASKKSTNILDGSYKSIYRGRSLDFDNLRDYIVGDNVKDIDWKASIRSGNLLVRQYVAEKKHNILLVFDSSMEMLGDAPSGESKYSLAALAAGTIAYLAVKNGDFVAGLWKERSSERDSFKFLPYHDSLVQIEKILTFYEDYMSDFEKVLEKNNEKTKGEKSEENSLNVTLDYALRFVPRRSVIFVFTDLQKMKNVDVGIIKRLIIAHDVLFVNIRDASITSPEGFDLEANKELPAFLKDNLDLQELEKTFEDEVYKTSEKNLKRFRVSSTTLQDSRTLTPAVVELLERHRYANIR